MGKWKKGDSLDAVRKPTAIEIAFFAGFYEGEGSCSPVMKCKSLSVDVRQKDPELLYRARDLSGGSVKFSAQREGKASPTFEGYESWKNPIFSWRLSGDRGRKFLRDIYPFLSSRRRAQVDKIGLTPTGRLTRQSPQMSPEREARRSTMSDHEKYLESKAHHRATHLEHCRQKDRGYWRTKQVSARKGEEFPSERSALAN